MPDNPFRIAKAGAYKLDPAVYHADPCPEPSLSHSIMRTLLERSPRHARWAHPRLNPSWSESPPTEAQDRGTVLHAMLLGMPGVYAEIRHDSFRTAAAREARDEARAAGQVPMLIEHVRDLRVVADAVLEQMRDRADCAPFFEPGRSEVTLAWQEGPVWCRGLVDRLPNRPGAPLYDFKSTAKSAAPDTYQHVIERTHALQAPWYLRGACATLERPPSDFLFLAFETSPPYALSVLGAAPSLLEATQPIIQMAVELWARCLITETWPGYPTQTAYVEAPVWLSLRAEEMRSREAELRLLQKAEDDRRAIEELIDGEFEIQWGG